VVPAGWRKRPISAPIPAISACCPTRRKGLPPGAPLVVVLHGCTQTAQGYDDGAGWSTLADRHGFAVLLPEQQRANNPNLCFNWFLPSDTTRGKGEALSIREMIDRAVADHGLDASRVFVTGLSAGGAMAAAMLATYPEVFAGGAIIAGLPYGVAGSVQEALDAMYQGRSLPAQAWGDRVRSASPHKGPWPKISIWHGSADATVMPLNAAELVKQWTDVHGLTGQPAADGKVDGQRRQVWKNSAGEALVESYTIAGMAHGTPIAAAGPDGAGTAGPYILETGISSSVRIAEFWGLTSARQTGQAKSEAAKPAPKPEPARSIVPRLPLPAARSTGPVPGKRPSALNPQAVIEKALKKAGLLKS
jgi:feruloyl esterase